MYFIYYNNFLGEVLGQGPPLLKEEGKKLSFERENKAASTIERRSSDLQERIRL